jgi:Domain of unknown function (DUF4167)
MKQNNNNRRARGRGPRKPHGMGGGHNKGQGYDGGGQELRVRGNAYQVLEKYLQLARDAGASGDRIAAENFLQHADHYYRVLSAMNDGQRPRAGGRELSVADVNVQNVSQGLSAALYSSGGPNPQGIPDSDMPGQAAPGQNVQGQNPQGPNTHGQGGGSAQGGHRQGDHRLGDHRQGGHQQSGHQQSARHEGQQAAGGNAAPNGHGNYAERSVPPAPTYAQPTEPPRAAPPAVAEEQPDYPEELLRDAVTAEPAAPAAVDDAEDGVQRTLRAPRTRLRGPGRRGPRQGDGRQSEARPSDGQGSADPSE